MSEAVIEIAFIWGDPTYARAPLCGAVEHGGPSGTARIVPPAPTPR